MDSNSSSDGLQKWLSFTQRINSSLDLQETIRATLDETLELTGMRRGFIMTVDFAGALHFQIGRTSQGETLQQQEFEAVMPFATRALFDQQIHSFSDDPSIISTKEKIGSGFCIPLFSYRAAQDSKKPIGVLYADTPEIVQFDAAETEILNVLALHAGPAIENALLYDVATRDPMTHLYLGHFFDSLAIIEWRRTLRHTHPVSILAIDLDEFRIYNEQAGRDKGDVMLQKTADILRNVCRTEDIISRYGANEFAVLLPETDALGARHMANRVFEESSALSPLTLSIGIATYPRCTVTSVQELVKISQLALKQAKQAGKNRVIAYEPSLNTAHTKLF